MVDDQSKWRVFISTDVGLDVHDVVLVYVGTKAGAEEVENELGPVLTEHQRVFVYKPSRLAEAS